MKWKLPPRIKVFEALGAISDGRVELNGGVEVSVGQNLGFGGLGPSGVVSAKVYSSSKGKYYTVTFDPVKKALMCNDNGSYWVGYLGYPAIAVLMVKGILPHDKRLGSALAGILWKDINQKLKNDFDKTEKLVFELVEKKGVNGSELVLEAEKVLNQIKKLDLALLGEKTKPPEGY